MEETRPGHSAPGGSLTPAVRAGIEPADANSARFAARRPTGPPKSTLGPGGGCTTAVSVAPAIRVLRAIGARLRVVQGDHRPTASTLAQSGDTRYDGHHAKCGLHGAPPRRRGRERTQHGLKPSPAMLRAKSLRRGRSLPVGYFPGQGAVIVSAALPKPGPCRPGGRSQSIPARTEIGVTP